MTKISRKQLLHYLLFALVLCVTRSLSRLGILNDYPWPTILGLIQTSLYVSLIAFWCSSVRRRIVQPQIRAMLECVSVLMIFWHLTKGVKYHIVAWLVGQGWMMRYLWYLYYLPLLLIPAFLIMTAFSLRKPESYRLPKKAVITLLSVSVALFLCVITNDLHQLVFDFPADAVVFTDREYTHGILYYLCFAWIVAGSLAFFTVTLKSCRLPNKRFLWLPIIPIPVCIFYCAVYILGNGVWFILDFTTMFTFSLIIILETAIFVGLIPSNSHYAELFRASDRSGFITDESLNVVYASEGAESIEKDILQEVIEQGSVTQGGIRINCSSITGGYIFWRDDITKLLEINEILECTKEELRSYGSLLEEENKQKKRRQKLIERQSLYESIRKKTEPQQSSLSELAQRLQETTDEEQAEMLLHQITVLGAYVKRRSNLGLLASKADSIPVSELELCIRESVTYLTASGITAAARFELMGTISSEAAERLYDFFESAVEISLDSLKAITAFAYNDSNKITLHMMLDCDTDMNTLKAAYPDSGIQNDGNTWFCSLTANGGTLS